MLTAAQQRGIAAGIVAFMLLSRVASLLVEGGMLAGTAGWALWTVRFGGTAAIALVLPFGVVAIDWLHARADRQPLRMFALNVINGLGIGCVTHLLYGLAMPAERGAFEAFALFWATGTLVSAAAAGIVGAAWWSRSVVEADAVAAQLLTEESQRTRELIRRRFRPGATVATLRRIGRLLQVDAARAVELLYRIARHERVLLLRHSAHWRAAETLQSLRRAIALERRDVSFAMRGFADWPATPAAARVVAALDAALDAAGEVSVRVDTVHEGGRVFARFSIAGNGADAFRETFTENLGGDRTARAERIVIDLGAAPRAIANERETSGPQHHAFSVVVLMLAYVAVCFLVDDKRSSWEATWFFATASLISVLLWLIAGPLLGWMLERKASPRFLLLLAQAALLMLLAAGVITIASICVMAMITNQPAASLFEMPAVTAVVFRRNSILAMVVGATSAAAGISRLLRSRHAMIARLQSVVHQAEAREIEACFHPHFLLNALTSIKSLARTDPIEAAAMTGRLGDLVEKIAGSSGVSYWTVRQEIELVSDYIEIQRMRFKTRLRVETWDVDPAALEERLPRFILLPLLENIFKHAVSRSAVPVTVGLSVRFRRGQLTGTVWNDAAGARAQHAIGRGLSFVLHRVEEAGGTVKIGMETGAKRDGRFLVRFAIARSAGGAVHPIGMPAVT